MAPLWIHLQRVPTARPDKRSLWRPSVKCPLKKLYYKVRVKTLRWKKLINVSSKLTEQFPWKHHFLLSFSGYSCALVGDILLQGHLYITENYFAFYSNVFGYITKVSLSISKCLKKLNIFLLISASNSNSFSDKSVKRENSQIYSQCCWIGHSQGEACVQLIALRGFHLQVDDSGLEKGHQGHGCHRQWPRGWRSTRGKKLIHRLGPPNTLDTLWIHRWLLPISPIWRWIWKTPFWPVQLKRRQSLTDF